MLQISLLIYVFHGFRSLIILRLWWTSKNATSTSCNARREPSSRCKCKFAFDFLVAVRCFFESQVWWRLKMTGSSLFFPSKWHPFSFPTNQKVGFWGKSQTVVTFSLNRCSMCTLPQKLLKVLKRVLVTFSSVVPAFRPLFLMNEPSFLGVFRCFWAFFGHFYKNIPPYYTLLNKSSGSSPLLSTKNFADQFQNNTSWRTVPRSFATL